MDPRKRGRGLDDEESTEDEPEKPESDADSIADAKLDELDRRIDNYFKIFDQNGESTIEVNELG